MAERQKHHIAVAVICTSEEAAEETRALLRTLPADTGMAFVVAFQGGVAESASLAGLLGHSAALRIVRADEGMRLEADTAYVIPPGMVASLTAGALRLRSVEARDARARRHAVDLLLRSVAEQAGERSAAVILTGRSHDGALGAQAVGGAGGLVLVQDPVSAHIDDAPAATIATGAADRLLPVDEMPAALLDHARSVDALAVGTGRDGPLLEPVLAVLRRDRGLDLRRYRRNSLVRRLQRRMALARTVDVDRYLELLSVDPLEIDRLARDLLVRVTSFFRDPATWEALRVEALAPLVADGEDDAPIRMWSAGCATGEEAYTLAMLVVEELERQGKRRPLQIFATDLDARSLEVARSGRYSDAIDVDVGPERLERFFEREGGAYRVRRELRENIVFAPHDLLADPPFSYIDVLSCRNLLIYLERETQESLQRVFHHGLNEGGHLVLGTSETVGRQSDAFQRACEGHPIFRNGPKRRSRPTAPLVQPVRTRWSSHAPAREERDVAGAVHRHIVRRFGPAAVLVGDDFQALYFTGATHRFLRQPTGAPVSHVLDMLPADLRAPVRSVVEEARVAGESSILARTRDGDHIAEVLITSSRLPGPEGAQGAVLVAFEQVPPSTDGSSAAPRTTDDPQVRMLELELHRTRDELQRAIEDLESSNEELTSSNEVVMSMNEELQSANEELETSKEELQSLNEELVTVNSQLEEKVTELEDINDDLSNLLRSTDIATLFLDRELRIRRYTPAATRLLRLIPSDVGRPLTDLAGKIDVEAVQRESLAVLDRLVPTESAVQAEDGTHYIRRVLPYRTGDQRIEGVVVVFTDVTALTDAEQRSTRQALEAQLLLRATTIVSEAKTFREILAGCIDIACELIGWPVGHIWLPEEDGGAIVSTGIWHLDDRERREALVKVTAESRFERGVGLAGWIMESGQPRWFEDLPTNPDFLRGRDAELEVQTVLGFPIKIDGEVVAVLELFHDDRVALDSKLISLLRSVGEQIGRAIERKRATEALHESEARLREQARRLEEGDRHKNEFLAMLGHELRNPLAPIRNAAALLDDRPDPDPERARAVEIILRQSDQMRRLVDDLLDVARITRGAIQLEMKPVDLTESVRDALDTVRGQIAQRKQQLHIEIPQQRVPVHGDPVRLTQIVSNLLANAVKYTGERGELWVCVGREDGRAVLRVRDSGVGIDPERLPEVFEAFTQFDQSIDRAQGGLGLGLTLVQSLVQQHGGTISAASAGRHRGAEFVVRLPLLAQDALGAVDAARAPEPRSVKPLRILVVDDNEDAASTMALILSRGGHDVATAHGGREALERAREHRPDVVFLDIGLPDIDGYEVARMLRKDGGGEPNVLVAVTGYGQERDRALAQEAGFDRHLLKPVTHQTLQSVLADAAERLSGSARSA